MVSDLRDAMDLIFCTDFTDFLDFTEIDDFFDLIEVCEDFFLTVLVLEVPAFCDSGFGEA